MSEFYQSIYTHWAYKILSCLTSLTFKMFQWESYLKSKLTLEMSQFLKTLLPLILGGMRAFTRRHGMCVWDWWDPGVLARIHTALHELESSQLSREAQTVLHPSVSGKRLPDRSPAMAPDATAGRRQQRSGGRRRSCTRPDSGWKSWLPAGHGHRAKLQVVSKHCVRLHLHPGAV